MTQRMYRWGAGVVAGMVGVVALVAMFSISSVSQAEVYAPDIDPKNFTTKITHPHFSLPAGGEFIYEGYNEEGELEHVEIVIPGRTKKIMGVNTLVYRDTVWIDGEIVEDTTDYLAQDKDGNVWYFGEKVDNYENGKVVDHEGSWMAGEDGALPGYWLPANLYKGLSYYQEYQLGIAEDRGTVLSVNETVTVPTGTYRNCVKTLDWSELIPKEDWEHKYYCPGVAAFVKEANADTKHVSLELIEVGGKND